MDQPRILLSGFQPFGNFKTNPSWEALKLAQRRGLLAAEAAFGLVEVPVTFDLAFAVFKRAALGFAPDAALCFGVHGGMAGRGKGRLYIERVARNLDAASKPDNAGVERAGSVIHPLAPAALPSEFPVEALLEPLLSAGFEAEFSDDAGGYLCNHLYFRACHAFRGQFPVAFVHVPPVKGEGGSLELERLAQAVATLANTAARLLPVAGIVKESK